MAMTTITAADVKKLRDQTGAGMMECKSALDRGQRRLRGGEHDPAQARPGERREEGRTRGQRRPDRPPRCPRTTRAGIARRGELRVRLRRAHRRLPAADRRTCSPRSSRPATPPPRRGSRTRTARSRSCVAAGIAKLGENMAVPRFVRYAGQGYVGQYIHMGGKIGVQVEFGGVTPGGRRPRGVRDAGQGNRDADRRGEPGLRVARRGPGRRAREGKGDLPRADGELRQAGQRHRQDRRGQARKLLLAGRAARSGVDPRSEDDGEGRARRGRQGARRLGHGDALRSAEGRRSRS